MDVPLQTLLESSIIMTILAVHFERYSTEFLKTVCMHTLQSTAFVDRKVIVYSYKNNVYCTSNCQILYEQIFSLYKSTQIFSLYILLKHTNEFCKKSFIFSDTRKIQSIINKIKIIH